MFENDRRAWRAACTSEEEGRAAIVFLDQFGAANQKGALITINLSQSETASN
jgi:hypothetical protein